MNSRSAKDMHPSRRFNDKYMNMFWFRYCFSNNLLVCMTQVFLSFFYCLKILLRWRCGTWKFHCSLEPYKIINSIFDSRTGDGNSDSTETGPDIIIISIVVPVMVVLVLVVMVIVLLRRKRRSSSKHVFL